MAERKSGPVKPPVIDLKARDATETGVPKPAETASAAGGEPHAPTEEGKPRNSERGASPHALAATSIAATERGASPHPPASPVPPPHEGEGVPTAPAVEGVPTDGSAPGSEGTTTESAAA